MNRSIKKARVTIFLNNKDVEQALRDYLNKNYTDIPSQDELINVHTYESLYYETKAELS